MMPTCNYRGCRKVAEVDRLKKELDETYQIIGVLTVEAQRLIDSATKH